MYFTINTNLKISQDHLYHYMIRKPLTCSAAYSHFKNVFQVISEIQTYRKAARTRQGTIIPFIQYLQILTSCLFFLFLLLFVFVVVFSWPVMNLFYYLSIPPPLFLCLSVCPSIQPSFTHLPMYHPSTHPLYSSEILEIN